MRLMASGKTRNVHLAHLRGTHAELPRSDGPTASPSPLGSGWKRTTWIEPGGPTWRPCRCVVHGGGGRARGCAGARAISAWQGGVVSWNARALDVLAAGPPTPLINFPVPAPGIRLLLKDESAQPTGSLRHRHARALFRQAILAGLVTEGTTVVEATGGNAAVAQAWFARRLGFARPPPPSATGYAPTTQPTPTVPSRASPPAAPQAPSEETAQGQRRTAHRAIPREPRRAAQAGGGVGLPWRIQKIRRISPAGPSTPPTTRPACPRA
ncbi:pyridoxal-phosphate dependent enzyme [Nonomuraea polychroma]|uniref:pyridoxal-phosphate dependent enzyme n=1 Tax=Nonomuraea polychroma TaxID=46176 RepID=UPI003D8E6102